MRLIYKLLIFCISLPVSAELVEVHGSNIVGANPYAKEICADLKLGQKAKVYYKAIESETKSLGAAYQIQKLKRNEFRVDLNLFFTADKDYNGRADTKKVDAFYRAKLKSCIRDLEESLVDSSGRRLKIRINDKAKKSTYFKGPHIPIKIGSDMRVSNSTKYASNVDCPTMVHEVMHLLGLCDEGKVDEGMRYDCRLEAKKDTAMSEYYSAFPQNYKFKVLTCGCPKSGCKLSVVRDFVNSGANNQICPKGYKLNTEPEDIVFYTRREANEAKELFLKSLEEENDEIYLPLPVRYEPGVNQKPVLENRQIDFVLYPNCKAKNKKSYACYKNAYRTSTQMGGSGCLPEAPECNEEGGW